MANFDRTQVSTTQLVTGPKDGRANPACRERGRTALPYAKMPIQRRPPTPARKEIDTVLQRPGPWRCVLVKLRRQFGGATGILAPRRGVQCPSVGLYCWAESSSPYPNGRNFRLAVASNVEHDIDTAAERPGCRFFGFILNIFWVCS
jgi:hypothetical protein